MQILIVDDSAAFRQATKHLLSKIPYYQVVAEAENGKIALELQEKYHPDLILMDIEMPEMDGIEATKLLLKKDKNLKIIAISAHQENLYVKDILKAGFIAFVNKNNVFDQLENAIESAIKGKLYLML